MPEFHNDLPFKILLVEGDADDRLAFRKALKKSNPAFSVAMRPSAEQALNMATTSIAEFDLVVTGYKLPGMSGMEFFEKVRQRGTAPPVVMLTADGSEYLAVDAMKQGFADYVVKDPEGWYLDLLPLLLPEVIRRCRDRKAREWMDNAMRRTYDGLERRIQERTRELTLANQSLTREIDQRKKAQKALEKSERQLRVLSKKLMDAQENERRAVAGEIHDSISSSLVAVKYSIQNRIDQIEQCLPPGEENPLDYILSLVQNTIDETRRIMISLRPSMLDDLGLLPTIGWWCREFGSVYKDIDIETQIPVTEEEVPDDLKIVIYRILQEALNNAARHSRAKLVSVSLFRRDNRLVFSVKDDGEGFDVREAMKRNDLTSGLGLSGMRERAQLSGGRFFIESSPGKGTRVEALWSVAG